MSHFQGCPVFNLRFFGTLPVFRKTTGHPDKISVINAFSVFSRYIGKIEIEIGLLRLQCLKGLLLLLNTGHLNRISTTHGQSSQFMQSFWVKRKFLQWYRFFPDLTGISKNTGHPDKISENYQQSTIFLQKFGVIGRLLQYTLFSLYYRFLEKYQKAETSKKLSFQNDEGKF